jgi:hypothetical protein
VELGRGDVERERDVGARGEAGLLDRLGDEVERGAVARQVGAKPPSSPRPVARPLAFSTDLSAW